ncbi:MAG TPA: hypothetical protein DCM07_11230 [Planctomycetaceae bacterium]|nr:hypothetical protein [Gimesia sp.]HAH45404.1 hypothetical protein [Planctomycetaceae bacterium]
MPLDQPAEGVENVSVWVGCVSPGEIEVNFAAVPNVRSDPFPGAVFVGRFMPPPSLVERILRPQIFSRLTGSRLIYADQPCFKRSQEFFSTFLLTGLRPPEQLYEKLEMCLIGQSC